MSEGQHPVSDRDADPPGARLASTTRPASTSSPRPARRRRRDRVDRLDRRAIAAAGVPVTAVADAHRLPRVPRRSGEDAAPARARRDPRRPAQAETTGASSSELGIAPFDLVVVNLYPFAETVASGAAPDECVEQIDIGGPSMVRAAAKNHPSVAVVTSPDAVRRRPRRRRRRRLHPRRSAGASPPRRSSHTATYDVAVASWIGSVVAPDDGGTRLPGLDRRAPGSARDVLRYGENPHQRGRALRRRRTTSPGSRRPSSCTARRCPTTTTSTPTPRGARPTTTPSRPSRSSSTPTRAASRSAPTSPRPTARPTRRDPVSAYGGVIAANRPVTRGDGRADRRRLHRGRRRAGLRRRGARDPAARRRTCACSWPPARTRPRIEIRPISRRPAAAGGRPRRRRRRRPGDLDARQRRAGRRGDAARPRVRLARLPVGEVATRSCSPTDGAAVGVGMGQVNRVDSARLAVERAGDRARRVGRRVGRVLPVRRRARGADRRRACGPSCSPGGSVRDDEVIAAATGGRASRCTSPGPATSSTEPGADAASAPGRGDGIDSRAPPPPRCGRSPLAFLVGVLAARAEHGSTVQLAIEVARRPPGGRHLVRHRPDRGAGHRAVDAGTAAWLCCATCRRTSAAVTCRGGSSSAGSSAAHVRRGPGPRRPAARRRPVHRARGRRVDRVLDAHRPRRASVPADVVR